MVPRSASCPPVPRRPDFVVVRLDLANAYNTIVLPMSSRKKFIQEREVLLFDDIRCYLVLFRVLAQYG